MLFFIFDFDGFNFRTLILAKDIDGFILINLAVKKRGNIIFLCTQQRGNRREIDNRAYKHAAAEND